MSETEKKLAELGLTLPPPPSPRANYISYKRVGDLIFLAGMGPADLEGYNFNGTVGKDLDPETAKLGARMAALNVLATLKKAVGDLDKVEIVRMLGFVRSTDDFYAQPSIIDGASSVFVDCMGDRGRHTRVALGTNVLPFDTAIEIEVIAHVLP